MTDSEPEDRETDQSSRPKRYDKRIEDWVRGLQQEAEQRAPEVLDDLASTAKGVARYLEEQAEKTRAKLGQKRPAGESSEDQPAEEPTEIERSSPDA